MSLHDTLIKALMDTLMGMGTVFLILILICIVISLFKFIRKDLPQPAAAGAAAAEVIPEADEDEGELMAVIMAAIRMAKAGESSFRTEVQQDEPVYIVRSVKRRR